jgi:hypothetical protein
MAAPVLYASTISSAADFLGGYRILALILNVKLEDLHRWAAENERPPAYVFLRLMDLSRDR